MWRTGRRGGMLVRMVLLACCTFAALATTSPLAAGPHRAGWDPLPFESKLRIEIDRGRLRRDGGFVDAWVRTRPSREAVASEFASAGAEPTAIERVRASLSHSEHLWSFQCEDRTHALAYSAYYATDGTLIRDFSVERREYWPVREDTLGQRLLDEACGRDTLAAGDDEDDEPDTGGRSDAGR